MAALGKEGCITPSHHYVNIKLCKILNLHYFFCETANLAACFMVTIFMDCRNAALNYRIQQNFLVGKLSWFFC